MFLCSRTIGRTALLHRRSTHFTLPLEMQYPFVLSNKDIASSNKGHSTYFSWQHRSASVLYGMVYEAYQYRANLPHGIVKCEIGSQLWVQCLLQPRFIGRTEHVVKVTGYSLLINYS